MRRIYKKWKKKIRKERTQSRKRKNSTQIYSLKKCSATTPAFVDPSTNDISEVYYIMDDTWVVIIFHWKIRAYWPSARWLQQKTHLQWELPKGKFQLRNLFAVYANMTFEHNGCWLLTEVRKKKFLTQMIKYQAVLHHRLISLEYTSYRWIFTKYNSR